MNKLQRKVFKKEYLRTKKNCEKNEKYLLKEYKQNLKVEIVHAGELRFKGRYIKNRKNKE